MQKTNSASNLCTHEQTRLFRVEISNEHGLVLLRHVKLPLPEGQVVRLSPDRVGVAHQSSGIGLFAVEKLVVLSQHDLKNTKVFTNSNITTVECYRVYLSFPEVRICFRRKFKRTGKSNIKIQDVYRRTYYLTNAWFEKQRKEKDWCEAKKKDWQIEDTYYDTTIYDFLFRPQIRLAAKQIRTVASVTIYKHQAEATLSY